MAHIVEPSRVKKKTLNFYLPGLGFSDWTISPANDHHKGTMFASSSLKERFLRQALECLRLI
jgi:hypothetical protein